MSELDPLIIQTLNNSLQLALPDKNSYEETRRQLADYLNSLISSNFDRLIFILYRVDVNEKKLKDLLEQNAGADAGYLIAGMLIERQAEKIKSRRENTRRDDIIDEEEKW